MNTKLLTDKIVKGIKEEFKLLDSMTQAEMMEHARQQYLNEIKKSKK